MARQTLARRLANLAMEEKRLRVVMSDEAFSKLHPIGQEHLKAHYATVVQRLEDAIAEATKEA